MIFFTKSLNKYILFFLGGGGRVSDFFGGVGRGGEASKSKKKKLE